MSLSIFVPGKAGCDPELLREVGLEALLRDGDRGPAAADLLGPGPDGQRGVLFSWGAPVYKPHLQQWHAAKPDPNRGLPGKRFWIGFDAGPVTPASLLRDEPARLDGYAVELADGQRWVVASGMMLPFTFALNDEGRPEKKPKREYEPFFERTLWAFGEAESYLAGDHAVDWNAGLEYCAFVLSINYRVNLEICLLLGLLDGATVGKVMAHSTDLVRLQAIAEDRKKKASVSAPNG